jgi:hypothetical protein
MPSFDRLTPARVLAALSAVVILGTASAQACTLDSECDDALLCNGAETCSAGACVPGTPAPDNTPCDTGVDLVCTLIDTCQGGMCVEGGGGDTDGDSVCDAEDDCPAVANTGQEDFDGDDVGNVCDDTDGVLEVVGAKLRLDTSPPGKRARGKIILKGDFVTTDPGDVFDPSGGLLVRVQDSVGLDVSFAWAAGECVTNPRGNHKCKSLDKRLKATLRPLSSDPKVVRYRILVKEISRDVAPGPFVAPVVVTLAAGPAVLTSGVDRVGAIVDCQQKGFGLSCRE